jgi:hypothetical protein
MRSMQGGLWGVDDQRVRQVIEAAGLRAVDGTEVKLSDIVVQPNEALVDSIDTVLTEMLGTRTRELIYDHLARECALAKEEVPTHLEEFFAAMEEGLGEPAAMVEGCIIRRFYSTLGWEFMDVPGFGLSQHVELIKGIVARAQRMHST